MRILNELVKNFKIIFRSWVSLALLILGPLALIFLIGFTFVEQEVHNPYIGIVAGDQETASSFIDQLGEVAEVNIYEDVKTCTQNIKRGKEHICIEIRKEDNKDARFQRSYFT